MGVVDPPGERERERKRLLVILRCISTNSCTVNIMKLELEHDSQGVLVFGRGRVRGEVDCFLLLLLYDVCIRA